MRPIRRHLTYSNAMVTILAFIVLTGGTAVALQGSNTVFSDDIVNGEVKSVDLAKLVFHPVKPNPLRPGPGPGSDPCDSGEVSVFCGYESGCCGLIGWRNHGGGYQAAAYARDGLGMVHLQGTMISSDSRNGAPAFILPSGYRPAAIREFAVPYGQTDSCGGEGCDEGLTVLQVRPSGVVDQINRPGVGHFPTEGVSLDGVSFRCGPSGSGCP